MTEKVVVDFDHHSKEYREHGMEIAAEARSKCPVAWSEHHGGYWFVTRLDEPSAFQKRPDLFSAYHELGNPDTIYKGIAIPFVDTAHSAGFLEMDPPDQLAYRRILNPLLSPSQSSSGSPSYASSPTHASMISLRRAAATSSSRSSTWCQRC